ncbi:MAG: hypothetical protein AB1659_01775 [Thermodesulfobacteriota bacterium]
MMIRNRPTIESKKMTVLCMTVLIVILIALFHEPVHGRVEERHRYRQTTGEKAFFYTWEKENRSPVKIRIVEPNDTFTILCDTAGETMEWVFSNQKSRVIAKKMGAEIHIAGTFQDRPYEEKVPMNNERWYQALPYALRQMVGSGRDEATFMMIRPDTLAPLRLKAVRLEPEAVTISGKKVFAHKLRLTLNGLLENMWSAYYWFRHSDGVFLQYKGTNGPPGTPETLIQLMD